MSLVILNADDFGMSRVYNTTILKLLREGKLTSTTVMINRLTDHQAPQVEALAALNRTLPISVGLHVEFTYDQYASQIADQFEKFVQKMGFLPSHLDVHKEHLYRDYHHFVADFCRKKGLPFRNHGTIFPEVRTTSQTYFYGTVDDFATIDAWLRRLEPGKSYELVVHPGTYDPDCYSSLNRDREKDLAYLERLYEERAYYNFETINFKQLPF